MNYNELPDREIDMLIATRAAGWKLSEESAYSPSGGRWARMCWDDGSERWLPYYTQCFDDVIAAVHYLLHTNERAIVSLTYNVIHLGATPRALCILILEALDAAEDKLF